MCLAGGWIKPAEKAETKKSEKGPTSEEKSMIDWIDNL